MPSVNVKLTEHRMDGERDNYVVCGARNVQSYASKIGSMENGIIFFSMGFTVYVRRADAFSFSCSQYHAKMIFDCHRRDE